MLDEAPELAPEIGDALERLGMHAAPKVGPAKAATMRNRSVEDPNDRSPGETDRQV